MAANSGIALFGGPQDPSQLLSQLNTLIESINPYIVGGLSNLPISAGTTSAHLPNLGVVTLSSTVASAAYVLSAPIQGQVVSLVTVSTKSQTVTLVSGNFNKSHTKMTFKTTGGNPPQQAVTLVGLSTSNYGITGMVGTVKTT